MGDMGQKGDQIRIYEQKLGICLYQKHLEVVGNFGTTTQLLYKYYNVIII